MEKAGVSTRARLFRKKGAGVVGGKGIEEQHNDPHGTARPRL